MFLARCLLLVVVATIAGMAIGPTVASAQEEPVEVLQEDGGQPCALTNCEVHLVGSSTLTLHAFGTESQNSACTDEFIARFESDGDGEIHHYANDVGSANCTKIACNGVGEAAAETEWPITNTGEHAGTEDAGHLNLRYCFDEEGNPNAAGRHCNLELDFAEHASHKYELEAVNEECPVIGMTIWTELDGSWESEADADLVGNETDIEIVHPGPSDQEEPVDVVNGTSGAPCAGANCKLHLVGNSVLALHAFGSESQFTACGDELVASLEADGSGAIHTYENDAATSADCTRVICNGVGEPAAANEWPVTAAAEYAGSEGEGHVTFGVCLDQEANPNAEGFQCALAVDLHEHANHKYGFEAVDEECPITGMNVWMEFDGSWESEAEPNPSDGETDVEVIHRTPAEPVEVVREDNGQHCALTNCELHLVGSSTMTLHAFGSESQNSACTDEFIARLEDDGSGEIHHYANDVGSANCTKIACNGVGEAGAETEWPITGTGEHPGTDHEGHLSLRYCLDEEGNPNVAGRHCDLELDFTEQANHKYRLDAINEECPVIGMTVWTELDGSWSSEADVNLVGGETDVEIIHAP